MAKKKIEEPEVLPYVGPDAKEQPGDLGLTDQAPLKDAEGITDATTPAADEPAPLKDADAVPLGFRRFRVMQPVAQLCQGDSIYPVNPQTMSIDLPGNETWYLDLIGGLLK